MTMTLAVWYVLAREHEEAPLRLCTVVAKSAQEAADQVREMFPKLDIIFIGKQSRSWK